MNNLSKLIGICFLSGFVTCSLVGGEQSLTRQKATADNIMGFLNTRFGGLFTSGQNILFRDFDSKYLKEAREKWDERVEDLFAIVKTTSSKKIFDDQIIRLRQTNKNILDALAYTFKHVIYPATKEELRSSTKYDWKLGELNLNKIDPYQVDINIEPIPVSYQKVIDEIRAALKKSKSRIELPSTKKARELLDQYADLFLAQMNQVITKNIAELKKAMGK